MNKLKKKLFFLVIVAMNIVFFDLDCIGSAHAGHGHQPSGNASKQLEHSLETFSRKVVSKNKVINLQYKRYGKQAVLSFDMIKPNEVMFMLYLLEYNQGDWRITKEYHYSKSTVPVSADLC